MRRPAFLLTLVTLLAAGLCAAQAPKPQRLALVIGNGSYKESPLPNPPNDAADIAAALEASGFTVIKRENATLREMHLALREFGDRLGRNATGLFYFAGHGLQVRGRNYLLPVDADIAREDEVAFAALDLGAVIEKMDTARNPTNLVILDACRNNPFEGRFQLGARGLAPLDAPPGTFLAFATAPGSVAADGTGRNGLYTHHLKAEIARPGVAVEEVFKAVRTAVRRDSKGLQIPWESTSLESSFVFREAPRVAAASAPAPAAAAAGAPRPSAPRVMPTSLGAPPVFVVGDRWTYRNRSLITSEERQYTTTVKEIRGDEVIYANGSTSDLVGNPIRTFQNGRVVVHKPSSHFYVFPMKNGDVRKDLPFVQEVDMDSTKAGEARAALAPRDAGNIRVYDGQTTITVMGEEEIEVPAGRIRALRLERSATWKQRNAKNSGTNTWTYWYSSAHKRWVLAESKNVTTQGKLLLHERIELISSSVQ